VWRDLFESIAMVVALFDLLTAVLAAVLWHRLRQPATVRDRVSA
jgi:hypothetical protein